MLFSHWSSSEICNLAVLWNTCLSTNILQWETFPSNSMLILFSLFPDLCNTILWDKKKRTKIEEIHLGQFEYSSTCLNHWSFSWDIWWRSSNWNLYNITYFLFFVHTFFSPNTGSQTFPNASFGWVNVKDVAESHIKAFEIPSASGRYCMVERVVHYSEIVKILKELYPDLQVSEK